MKWDDRINLNEAALPVSRPCSCILEAVYRDSHLRRPNLLRQLIVSLWHCWSAGSSHPGWGRHSKPRRPTLQYRPRSCRRCCHGWTCSCLFHWLMCWCSLLLWWLQRPQWQIPAKKAHAGLMPDEGGEENACQAAAGAVWLVTWFSLQEGFHHHKKKQDMFKTSLKSFFPCLNLSSHTK